VRLIYTEEEVPRSFKNKKSIFLAGPTPRSSDVESWRPEAIRLLEELGFDGIVFVPEHRDGLKEGVPDEVYEDWEYRHLNVADCILFWIPRKLRTMPGFTTNIEFGDWMKSGKMVLGAPKWAKKMPYIRIKAKRYGIPHFYNMKDTVEAALAMLERSGS